MDLQTRLAYKPNEAAAVLGLGRSTVYKLMDAGELESFKVGKTRLITHETCKGFIRRKSEEAAA